jgi:hypothetical protein
LNAEFRVAKPEILSHHSPLLGGIKTKKPLKLLTPAASLALLVAESSLLV